MAKVTPKCLQLWGNIGTPHYILNECTVSTFHKWSDMMHQCVQCMQEHNLIGHTDHSDPGESLNQQNNRHFHLIRKHANFRNLLGGLRLPCSVHR